MNKSDLKNKAAVIGYNLGFGAKRHFATYDIVEKVPAYFGVVTFAIGIILLRFQNSLIADLVSILTITVGFAIFYLNFYSSEKEKYFETGKKLNIYYNRVRDIYVHADSAQPMELQQLDKELTGIYEDFQKTAIHKQVFFSNEFAHFKLFFESDSSWFSKELKLTFLKDKIPAIWRVYFLLSLIFLLIGLSISFFLNRNLIECISEKLHGG
jgi:hypothetical protein